MGRTIAVAAFLPSMKPAGIALGVRISYLRDERNYEINLTEICFKDNL